MAKSNPNQQEPSKPSKRKRATQSEKQAFINQIIHLIGLGYPNQRIRQLFLDQGIHPKKIQRALRSAWDTIAGLSTQATDEQLGSVILTVNYLLNTTLNGEDKNVSHAIQLLKLKEKMLTKSPRGSKEVHESHIGQSSLHPKLKAFFEETESN
jgi:hypothetical protein